MRYYVIIYSNRGTPGTTLSNFAVRAKFWRKVQFAYWTKQTIFYFSYFHLPMSLQYNGTFCHYSLHFFPKFLPTYFFRISLCLPITLNIQKQELNSKTHTKSPSPHNISLFEIWQKISSHLFLCFPIAIGIIIFISRVASLASRDSSAI